MASLRKKGKYYYVCFSIGTKRTSRSTKSASKEVANKIRAKIENDIATGKFRIEDCRPNKKSLKKLLDEALTYSSANKAKSTVTREKRIFRNFLKEIGDIEISRVLPKSIEAYKAYLLNTRGFKASSVNIELRHLSAAFSLAVKDGDLTENPFKKVRKLKTPAKQPVYLKPADAKKLLGNAQQHGIFDHVLIALNTGGRISEVCGLTWKDVDLQQKTLRLFGKGAKQRTVPIPGDLLQHLIQKQKQHEPIIEGTTSPDAVSRRFRKLADSVALPDFTFHKLRDTYASWLAQQGVSPLVIKELLGHTAIQTTMIYTHLSPASKLAAVKALNQVSSEISKISGQSDSERGPGPDAPDDLLEVV